MAGCQNTSRRVLRREVSAFIASRLSDRKTGNQPGGQVNARPPSR